MGVKVELLEDIDPTTTSTNALYTHFFLVGSMLYSFYYENTLIIYVFPHTLNEQMKFVITRNSTGVSKV
jgi:hypothetical protein